jgi:gliding motility-associated-like protein
MKKIILILNILAIAIGTLQAQQIKRWTLSSNGKTKNADQFRVSWTAGSCPGCTVLHPPIDTAPYLRQGFQQPAFNGNSPDCPPLTPNFNIVPMASAACGTKFDFEYTGTAVPNLEYVWDFGVDAFPRTASAANPLGVFYTSPGLKIIALKVQRGNCVESRARTLNILPNQVGFATTAAVTDVKCFGNASGAIKLTASGGTGAKTFRWSNGSTAQELSNIRAGRYFVTAMDANGCTFILDTTVKQPTAPLAIRDSVNKEGCKDYKDGSIHLTASGGTKPYRYQWGANANNATTAEVYNLVSGSYSVTITDTNACRLDTIVLVGIKCNQRLGFQLYDVITPNGDGKNDTWEVATILNYPNNELFIYNRWGQLVYTTKGYRNDWAGTNQDGAELPTAAYYYIFKLNDDKQTVWDGSVSILR